jgi:hypothetical protein
VLFRATEEVLVPQPRVFLLLDPVGDHLFELWIDDHFFALFLHLLSACAGPLDLASERHEASDHCPNYCHLESKMWVSFTDSVELVMQ